MTAIIRLGELVNCSSFLLLIFILTYVDLKLGITNRAWRLLGQLRFVTPELKPNIVMLLIVFTNAQKRSVELVTKGK